MQHNSKSSKFASENVSVSIYTGPMIIELHNQRRTPDTGTGSISLFDHLLLGAKVECAGSSTHVERLNQEDTTDFTIVLVG